MKYKVIDNFISKTECLNLINDSKKFLNNEDLPNFNSRKSLRSSNLQMFDLANKSKNWKNLLVKINSDEFFQFCLKNLELNNELFLKVDYVNKIDKISRSELSFKILGNQKLSVVNFISLFKYLLFRQYMIIKKKLFFLKFKFKKVLPVEFIYDYSQSGNGYGREIHRDSDSRIIVILIYLNELSEKASGGELNVYKYANDNKKIPSRPDPAECELIGTVKPYPGTLVLFQNSSDALHEVPGMSNHSGLRYFIYGGFTLLTGKNPYLLNSSDTMKSPDDLFI